MESLLTSLLTYIIAPLFALSVIVFVHESGHFLVAKLFGVRVLTFSIGFGRRLFGFRRGDTDYRLSLIPLGGYVRMAGEFPGESMGDPRDFLNKPRWQRFLVYLAGPAMNVVLAVAVIAAVFMIGTPMQALQDIPPIIGAFEEGSVAEAAGWQIGDRVLSVDGEEITLWTDLAFLIASSPGRALDIELERDGERFHSPITPRVVERHEYGDAGIFPRFQLRLSEILKDGPAHRAGLEPGDLVIEANGKSVDGANAFVEQIEANAGQELLLKVKRGERMFDIPVVPEISADSDGKGRIGVRLGYYQRLPLGAAIVESIKFNVDTIRKTVQVLDKLFSRELKPQSALSGPIEIAVWIGKAASISLVDLFYMMGFLSISIGFMNMLPIPVLDGGHIMILMIEGTIRRDLSIEVKERVTQFGFMVLMMLMVAVIFFDLSKNLPGLMPGS